MKGVKMDAEFIFAEDVEVCPKCGSSEFWENRIIWTGDDPTDEELASIECKVCGAVFYARDYYRRRFGKPEAEEDDEDIPF
jgi:predicted nucleic-acid-binding Zn-ribbon protein